MKQGYMLFLAIFLVDHPWVTEGMDEIRLHVVSCTKAMMGANSATQPNKSRPTSHRFES